MSELHLSNTTNNTKYIISLLISSFIIFLYFIFFFLPFFLKLISFLSPPFIATSLLVITISSGLVRENNPTQLSKREVNGDVLENLQPKVDDVDDDDDDDEDEFFHSMESLEVYKNVIDENNPEEKVVQAVESSVIKIPFHDEGDLKEEKRFGEFLKELDEFESVNWSEKEESLVTMNGSMARKESQEDKDVDSTREYKSRIKKAHSQRQSVKAIVEYINNGGEFTSEPRRSRSMEYDLGGYGSTRREKEWKRTLAGKLFEERHHNGDASEGMDLLWETYEMESSKGCIKKKDSKSKGKIENYVNEDDDGGDEDEDEEIEGPMCCLQAFKFSAEKMNMGVGRRSLVRFSKAVKGFGWLHHVSKQRKKVYNGDTFQFA